MAEKKSKGTKSENKTASEKSTEKEKPEMIEHEDYAEKLEAEKEKFLRLFAEFENYKKRTSRERLELFKTAGQEVLMSMLPVLDDFDRAVEQLSKIENGEFLQGVKLIQNKFVEVLKSNGLQIIKVEKGDNFDSDLHEAVTQIDSPDDSLKGKIIDNIEKGYKLGEKIIRHPKVVVGK